MWNAAQQGDEGAVRRALVGNVFTLQQVLSAIRAAVANNFPAVVAALLDNNGGVAIPLRATVESALMLATMRGSVDVAVYLASVTTNEEALFNAVCQAASHGQLGVVAAMLAHCGPTLLQHDVGPCAITKAAKHGHADVVALLLRSKASAEHATIPKRDITGADVGTLVELIAAGMDVNSTLWCYGSSVGHMAGHRAGHTVGRSVSLLGRSLGTPSAVKALLCAKATPQDQDIHHAIMDNRASAGHVVAMLLSAKGDAGAVCTPFDAGTFQEPLLASCGRVLRADVAVLLLRAKADPNATDSRGIPVLMSVTTSIHCTTEGADTDMLSLLLRSGVNVNGRNRNRGLATALHCATAEAAVVCLLGAKADPLCTDGHKRTALHIVAEYQIEFGRFTTTCMPAARVQALLGAKAIPDAVDCNGQTALHAWAHGASFPGTSANREKCDTAAVDLLLHSKASVNAVDACGNTPLHCAVSTSGFQFGHGYHRCVEMLLGAHAVPDVANLNGETPLQKLLTGGGALDGGRTAVACLLVGAKTCIHAAAIYTGDTALHVAARVKDTRERAHFIQVLLSAHADPNRGDVDGQTALHALLRHQGRRDDVGVEAMLRLLGAKADVNRCDVNGGTMLHMMAGALKCSRGFDTVLSHLLSAKADAAAKDNNGRTAMDTLVRGLKKTCRRSGRPQRDTFVREFVLGDERVRAFASVGLHVDARSLVGTAAGDQKRKAAEVSGRNLAKRSRGRSKEKGKDDDRAEGEPRSDDSDYSEEDIDYLEDVEDENKGDK